MNLGAYLFAALAVAGLIAGTGDPFSTRFTLLAVILWPTSAAVAIIMGGLNAVVGRRYWHAAAQIAAGATSLVVYIVILRSLD